MWRNPFSSDDDHALDTADYDPFANAPAWVAKRARAARPRLEQWVQASLLEMGSGGFGVTFVTRQGDRVVKVTSDSDEAACTSRVMADAALRELPGVVRLHALAELPAPRGRPAWTLVTERVWTPVPFLEDLDAAASFEHQRGFAQMILVAEGHKLKKPSPALNAMVAEDLVKRTRQRLIADYTDSWQSHMWRLSCASELRELVAFVGTFYGTFREPLGDVHRGNVGRRRNADGSSIEDWVLFDLGFTGGLTIDRTVLTEVLR